MSFINTLDFHYLVNIKPEGWMKIIQEYSLVLKYKKISLEDILNKITDFSFNMQQPYLLAYQPKTEKFMVAGYLEPDDNNGLCFEVVASISNKGVFELIQIQQFMRQPQLENREDLIIIWED